MKDIKGYEGLYQINENGEVYSVRKNKILSPYESNGYYKIDLTKDGKKKKEYIHRLIGETFILNPNNYKVINHIDGNRKNNNIDNLEWVSYSGNSIHSYYSLDNHKGCYNNRKVYCVELGIIFNTVQEAGRKTKTCAQSISKCCRGQRNTANGYHWKYAEEVV